MIKKINSIKNIILPNKKINIFILTIVLLGVITGSVFSTIIGLNDKALVIDKIKLFIDNINNNSINSLITLKNSLSINLIYVIIIWLLGMSLIGIIFNIFLLFLKSFIFGFSLSSFIITYSYKGLILSTLYLIFGQLLNLIIIIVLSSYGIILSLKLLNTIFKNKPTNDLKKNLKNYTIILVISILLSIISSLSESFLLPSLIKIIIKLFI